MPPHLQLLPYKPAAPDKAAIICMHAANSASFGPIVLRHHHLAPLLPPYSHQARTRTTAALAISSTAIRTATQQSFTHLEQLQLAGYLLVLRILDHAGRLALGGVVHVVPVAPTREGRGGTQSQSRQGGCAPRLAEVGATRWEEQSCSSAQQTQQTQQTQQCMAHSITSKSSHPPLVCCSYPPPTPPHPILT